MQTMEKRAAGSEVGLKSVFLKDCENGDERMEHNEFKKALLGLPW